MKVQCLNSSAIKTRKRIQNAFVRLIYEKQNLEKMTVTDLVKEADITRSTFYTHYDNMEEVAKEYQLQTIELLCNEDLKLHSKTDILNYFHNIFICLKENEDTYKLLITADASLLFLYQLKNIASRKIYNALTENNPNPSLDLTVSFFMNGVLLEIIKYFRNESSYSLEKIFEEIPIWFNKIFS